MGRKSAPQCPPKLPCLPLSASACSGIIHDRAESSLGLQARLYLAAVQKPTTWFINYLFPWSFGIKLAKEWSTGLLERDQWGQTVWSPWEDSGTGAQEVPPGSHPAWGLPGDTNHKVLVQTSWLFGGFASEVLAMTLVKCQDYSVMALISQSHFILTYTESLGDLKCPCASPLVT